MSNNKVVIKREIQQSIKDRFSVTDEAIKKCENSYNKIVSTPYEFLAHLVRTMEIFVREQKKKDYFRITITPNESTNVIKKWAWATYSGDWFSFYIFYDSDLDEIQTRVEIAHELGHLFYDVISKEPNADDRETLANLFGAVAMLHKYQCKNNTPDYKSEEDILAKFKLFNNENKGKINTSV